MSLDRLISLKGGQIKAGVVAALLLVSVIACKARASNPALNFAPVPDVAPQNSYADVVSRAAPARRYPRGSSARAAASPAWEAPPS